MGEGGNLNVQIGGLVLSMRGGIIFQRPPSSPPIKEGHPLLITTPQGRRATTLEKEHHSKGLRP